LVEPALLVEREARAGPALEGLARAALAGGLAVARLGWERPEVVFALGLGFELPLFGCGTFSSLDIDHDELHPTGHHLDRAGIAR
jgi:hypothetical protein